MLAARFGELRNRDTSVMTAIDYEAEYNNRARVPEHVEIMERWQMLSAAYRLASTPENDRPYGGKERQRYDLFVANSGSAPLVVYIHGGYWQRGDRKDFSFIARELNANGITVDRKSTRLNSSHPSISYAVF